MKNEHKALLRLDTLCIYLVLVLAFILAGCNKDFTDEPDTPPPPPSKPTNMPDKYFINNMLGQEKDIAMIINDPIEGIQFLMFGPKNSAGEMDSLTHILVKDPSTGGWLMHEFDEELNPASTTLSTGHVIEYENHNPEKNTTSMTLYESYNGKVLRNQDNVNMGDYFFPGLEEGKLRLFSPNGNSRQTASAEAIYLFSAVAGCGLGIASFSIGPTIPRVWKLYNTLATCKSAYDAIKNVLDGQPAFGCFNIKDHANALSGLAEAVKSGGGYGKIASNAMPGIMNYYAQRTGQSECNDSDSMPLPELPPPGLSDGDPHMRTIDGYYYDFQTWGEFVALESTDDDFEIQVRQTQPTPLVFPVTFNTAIAINTGHEVVCMISNPFSIYINNTAQDVNKTTISLTGGGYIMQTLVKKRPVWLIKTAKNDYIMIRRSLLRSIPYFGLSIYLAESRKGKVSGLLGNYDGNRFNDFRLKNGEAIEPDFENIHTTYADSWRVQQQSSLFYYAPGENTNTFTQSGFPQSHAQLPPDKKAWAESVCKSAGVSKEPFLGACVLDVIAMDDPEMAASSLWQMEVSGPDPLLPVDTTALILKGSATYTDNYIRLTQATASQVAQVFAKNSLTGEFETEFSFRIKVPSTVGGDGLALVIAKEIPGGEPAAGTKLGYTGIPASLAVESDNWVDGGETGDHVAIHTNGMEPNNAGYQYRKANYYVTSDFDDGKIHHARIRYKSKKIEVFLDQQKVLEYAVDLAATLGLNGSFYIRITASTGSAWQTHELGYWSWKNL